MPDYIYEKSNRSHPGITVMQNGDRNAFPIATFIDNLNGINNMLNGESEFYTLVTTGVTNREQLNSLITVTKNFLDQTELLINLKNLGEKVHVPDFEYFTAEFDRIMRTTKSNSTGRISNAQELYKSVSSVLQDCVEKNTERGVKRGLISKNFNKA